MRFEKTYDSACSKQNKPSYKENASQLIYELDVYTDFTFHFHSLKMIGLVSLLVRMKFFMRPIYVLVSPAVFSLKMENNSQLADFLDSICPLSLKSLNEGFVMNSSTDSPAIP